MVQILKSKTAPEGGWRWHKWGPYIHRLPVAHVRAPLRGRSEWTWSVRGGTGTAYGWIDVIAPPRRCYPEGCMMAEDREELAKLFHLDRPVHHQGLSISPEEREHYVVAVETP